MRQSELVGRLHSIDKFAVRLIRKVLEGYFLPLENPHGVCLDFLFFFCHLYSSQFLTIHEQPLHENSPAYTRITGLACSERIAARPAFRA